jgi:hypothetical protein
MEALGGVGVVEAADGFEFDEDEAFDEEVGEVLADEMALVVDGDGVLLLNVEAGVAEFDDQRVFVHLLQKTGA